MIGSHDAVVTGVDSDGGRAALLANGEWQL